ncbi:MAG: hypothetical protein II839_08785 [Kiritimatiellae bacterium]|nr:hypothetical protein [Kiritimatiellia bacterium]
MKRRLPKLLLTLALLVAAGWLVNEYAERRAEARDRELAERLVGPLLPGVPDTGGPLWNVSLVYGAPEPCNIQGIARATLGADLVRLTAPPPSDGSFRTSSIWLVGVGTPTESRLFESLLADPDARAACESPGISGRAFLVVDGMATNFLPDNVRERGIVPLKADGAGLRERLVSALDAESARADVSFAEERLTAGVIIVLSNGTLDEKPGRFRRAVGWCCKRLDFLPLDSLADWAAEERTRPSDPAFPLKSQILSLNVQEGQAAPCRMHQSGNKHLGQLVLFVDASVPLAASLRALLAKHRPENLGCPYDPKESVSQQSAVVTVVFPDRFEKRTVPLADTRLRAFLLDLLRLLAAPPPASQTNL